VSYYGIQSVSPLILELLQHPRSGKIKLVSPPVTYNGQKMSVRLPPPWLSEHTTEVRGQFVMRDVKIPIFAWQVLEELGYSRDEIESLRQRSII